MFTILSIRASPFPSLSLLFFSLSVSPRFRCTSTRRQRGTHIGLGGDLSRSFSLVNEHNSLPMQFPETGTNERREAKTGSKSSSIFSDMCDSQKLPLPRDGHLFREISPRKSVALKGYLAKAMINLDE